MLKALLRRFSVYLGTLISLAVFLATLAFTDTGRTTVEEVALERTVAAYEKKNGIPEHANERANTGSKSVLDAAAVLRVIDGDTLELANGERVRYIGIDTPESVDPRKPVECLGQEAAKRNRELVASRVIRLEADIENRDKYGRLLRYVYLEDGTMVNETLVREGYADPATFPPNIRYVERFLAAAAFAREEGRGLWGPACGEQITKMDNAAAASGPSDIGPGSDGCTIKGNVSSSGERIFHSPECPYYSRTKIDPARGEQYFCSESEAIAAGFRKAGNCPGTPPTPQAL